jgi:hypothetical protein
MTDDLDAVADFFRAGDDGARRRLERMTRSKLRIRTPRARVSSSRPSSPNSTVASNDSQCIVSMTPFPRSFVVRYQSILPLSQRDDPREYKCPPARRQEVTPAIFNRPTHAIKRVLSRDMMRDMVYSMRSRQSYVNSSRLLFSGHRSDILLHSLRRRERSEVDG